MTHTSSTGHPQGEREILYQALMANYHPPSFLKKHHKDQLKTAWSIRQGYDGAKLECIFCHVIATIGERTVHHRDGNDHHNDPDNLAPACWDCNRKEGWVVRLRKKAEVVSKEREIQSLGIGESDGDATDTSAYIIDKNTEGEPAARRWVVELLLKVGANPSEDAVQKLRLTNVIDAACEQFDFSQVTMYRYTKKMRNPINGFLKLGLKFDVKYLRFKSDDYYNLMPEQIENRHPKKGQRFRQVKLEKEVNGSTLAVVHEEKQA